MKRNGRKSLAGALARAKNESGFTLVELIVVIAILGILAGVGTVGYSGYIKKANMAADEILLDSLNTAFAAACIENNDDINSPNVTPTATLDADGKVASITYQDAFEDYYDMSAKFKVITALKFEDGMFVDADGAGIYSFPFAGTNVTLSAGDLAILRGENAFKNRGSAALLADVGTLQNLIDSGAGQDVLNEVVASSEFVDALVGYLGISREDYANDDEFQYAVESALGDGDALYNAQIMFAASNAANATQEQIDALFDMEGDVTSRIEGDTAQETMANAALAYGMYTAFVQQYPDDENADNFALAVNSDAFKRYYASKQGQTDLEAYKAAMNMISDNTSNSAITSSILENGINGNDALAKLMKDIMGN